MYLLLPILPFKKFFDRIKAKCICYSQFYYLKNFNRIKAKCICYSQFYHLKNFLTYYLGGTFKFFFGDTSVSPVSAPTPRRLFAPAIRFVAGPSYRRIIFIAISLFPSGRQGDTSIRRYVDTSIRRYVDTSILLRIVPRGTTLRRNVLTPCCYIVTP